MTGARREGVDSASPSPGGSSASRPADPELPSTASPSSSLTPAFAKARRENFPVASRLLPPRIRRHLMAFYGFARLVDDLGDEALGDREHLLDLVETDLDRIYADALEPEIPAMRDLSTTIRACEIPADPFRRLLQANRQDQVVSRYERFTDLVGYCELSANPVGHLVLYAFGAATPERMLLSDRICTALQLIEHCQDVVEDYERGRIYIPLEDLARFGCAESELAGPPVREAVRDLMAFETDRAATWLGDGAPLVGTLSGYARIATAGYVGGGRATLAAIREGRHDVFRSVPRPRPRRVAREALRLLLVGS